MAANSRWRAATCRWSKSGQRQVDLFDLQQVDLLTEAAQRHDFVFG